MSRAWEQKRRELLADLKGMGNAGRAENASQEQLTKGFYPVTEHLRLLDPDVVLVVGPRGAGKTQISKVLTSTSLTNAVGRFAPNVRLPDKADWLEAFPAQRQMFEGIGLKSFIEKQGRDVGKLREVWLAYLLRLVKDHLDGVSQRELSPLFTPPAADVAKVHAAFVSLGSKPIVAIDKLDAELERAGKHLFVTYDELDTLGNGDWNLIEVGIQGLVALWAAYTRRWRNLRAKLFLRTDLYDRHARTGGADLYKLAASRVELTWSARDLYAMLLKRIANESDALAAYLKDAKGIVWEQDEDIGLVPRLKRWEDAKPAIERLVGPFMGANQKKGLVYRWLLDHVRDGMNRAYPRPLVQMVEIAAGLDAASSDTLDKPRLLQPSSLRRALDRISSDYVTDMLTELPWLEVIRKQLKSNALVPYTEKEVVRYLDASLPDEHRPPYAGKELLDYLIELGILRRRPDGRIDAPDLFLHGLGLRRKGGVRRKK